MTDLLKISRRYGLTWHSDKALAIGPGRLVVADDGRLMFTASNLSDDAARAVLSLGTKIYRAGYGSVTVAIGERQIGELVALFEPEADLTLYHGKRKWA